MAKEKNDACFLQRRHVKGSDLLCYALGIETAQ